MTTRRAAAELHPLALAERTRRPGPAQALEVVLGFVLVAEARAGYLEHHGEPPTRYGWASLVAELDAPPS